MIDLFALSIFVFREESVIYKNALFVYSSSLRNYHSYRSIHSIFRLHVSVARRKLCSSAEWFTCAYCELLLTIDEVLRISHGMIHPFSLTCFSP